MRSTAVLFLALSTCSGGGQGQQGSGPGGPGDTHAGDLDTGDQAGGDAGAGEAAAGDAGTAVAPTGPQALVTFELKNSGTTEVEFNIDKGWGAVMFGYSGKPPKAKSIEIFPRFCTAACDAPEAEKCPKCERPEKAKEEAGLEQRFPVPAGKSHVIEWDGQVHSYQKTKAGKAKCDCFSKAMVPAESYTLRVCGLRVTKTAADRTRQQCVDQVVQLPPAAPTRLVFDFVDPKPAGKQK